MPQILLSRHGNLHMSCCPSKFDPDVRFHYSHSNFFQTYYIAHCMLVPRWYCSSCLHYQILIPILLATCLQSPQRLDLYIHEGLSWSGQKFSLTKARLLDIKTLVLFASHYMCLLFFCQRCTGLHFDYLLDLWRLRCLMHHSRNLSLCWCRASH